MAIAVGTSLGFFKISFDKEVANNVCDGHKATCTEYDLKSYHASQTRSLVAILVSVPLSM